MNKKIRRLIREIVFLTLLWGLIFLMIAICVMVYSFIKILWTQAAAFFDCSTTQLLKVTMNSAACLAMVAYVYKLTK